MTALRTRTPHAPRSRRALAGMSAATLSVAAVASFGVAPLLSPASATPRTGAHRVVVCHWVSAHGGSFVRIVIDESGLDGHDRHDHDVVGPRDDTGFDCDDTSSEDSDSTGSDHEDSDSSGSDHEDSDSSGSDHEDSDSQGSDSQGSDSQGSDSQGSDSQGSDHENSDHEDSDSQGSDQGDDEDTSTPAPEVDPTDEPTVENHRVVVCHWVPAHEGGVVRIEIDQNGLNGHEGHTHDVVGPVDDLTFSCDTETDPAPIEPTDPTEPTEPTDPTEPTVPSDPTDPIDPTDPTEPTVPSDPSSPSVPEDGSDNASGVVTVDDLASSSAAPTQLAHTGTQAGSIALLGAGLLAAGTFVLVAGRKRREV